MEKTRKDGDRSAEDASYIRPLMYCEECHKPFTAPFNIKPGIWFTFRGYPGEKHLRCPFCRTMNYFPSGIYANIQAKLVHVPDFAAKHEYEAFFALIEKAKNEKLEREEIIERIDTIVPIFAPLKVLLPTDRKELLVYLGMVLVILQIILGQVSDHTRGVVMSPEFEKTIEDFLGRIPVDPCSPSKEPPKSLPDTEEI